MSQERLPATKMGISVILEIEILSYPHLTVDDEQQIKIILSSLTHYHLSDEIKEQTIKLRRQFKVKLPDAIICATAMIQQAVLLTNDRQLINLPGLEAQSLSIH